ncbi:MAG: YraN family protein [Bacteroidales bacterium]|nr:YraN family protein [Bacteroidales bacterium]
MAAHNQLGKEGETVAADYLRDKGYTIREINWYSQHKELDIVAEHQDWLVVVEVKTRSGIPFEAPELAVDRRKIQRLVTAAHHYVHLHKLDMPIRFDVMALVYEKGHWQIEHFEDAFLATHT